MARARARALTDHLAIHDSILDMLGLILTVEERQARDLGREYVTVTKGYVTQIEGLNK